MRLSLRSGMIRVIKVIKSYGGALFVFISGLLAGVAVFFEWPNPLRWIVVFLFLVFAPGVAFSHLFPGKDQVEHAVLIIALSLAIDTLVAQLILYLGRWSPSLILLILLGISLAGVLSKLIPCKACGKN